MTITVALYAGLARYLSPSAQNRRAVLDLTEGATVLDAMRRLGMSDDLPCIPVVDGTRASLETILRDGETLSLFPPLTGGVAARRSAPSGIEPASGRFANLLPDISLSAGGTAEWVPCAWGSSQTI